MGAPDEILEATSPLYALIHGLTNKGGGGKPQASSDTTTTRSGAAPSGPAAKPPGFKDGGVVEKTGVAKVHKGEVVIPAPKGKDMAWKDATKRLEGKSKSPKGKKEVKEIRTRKGASGGFIHSHHFTDPSQEPEEHVSPDQASMLQHMAANMGGDGGSAPVDPNAAPAGPPSGAPQAAPAAAPGPQLPGGM